MSNFPTKRVENNPIGGRALAVTYRPIASLNWIRVIRGMTASSSCARSPAALRLSALTCRCW